MNDLDQIRANLLEASASLNIMGRNAPPYLRQQISDSWTRYALLVQQEVEERPRVGKKRGDNLGIVWFIPVLAGLGIAAAAGGFTWGITHELNESDRLKKLAQCVEEETKRGMGREKALKLCDEIYGTGGGGGGGFGNLDLTKVAIYSILGLAGFYMVKGALKDAFE
ncbi:MAG: hypothetical protein ACYS1A_17590 [Planctomycetota bacterium]|jgi:hypothetical protein